MKEPDKKVKEHFGKQGVFSWNELMTTDVEAAGKFYSGLLGWEFEKAPMQDGGEYVIAKVNDVPVAGMFKKPPHVPAEVPPHWGAYVTVDDVDAALAKAGELGAEVVFDIMHVPGVGRFCGVKDPQGAYFMLITYEEM